MTPLKPPATLGPRLIPSQVLQGVFAWYILQQDRSTQGDTT